MDKCQYAMKMECYFVIGAERDYFDKFLFFCMSFAVRLIILLKINK